MMRRLGPAVGAPVGSIDEEAAAVTRSNLLMSRPRCLYTLWDEYESGIDGGKAAKLLTAKERGKCKKVYSFRNRFWSVVEEMIRRGRSSRTAIERIYSVLGEGKSVTMILRALTPQVTQDLFLD